MANTFKLKTKANVGTATSDVYVVPAATTTVVIGVTLANNGTFVIESRNDTSDGQIIFRGRDASDTNEYARFDENGQLGIGTNNPQAKLDVDGVINSQTDIRVNDVSVLTSAENDAIALAIALG